MMNSGPNSSDAARLDAMSLGILREKETSEYVDYVSVSYTHLTLPTICSV